MTTSPANTVLVIGDVPDKAEERFHIATRRQFDQVQYVTLEDLLAMGDSVIQSSLDSIADVPTSNPDIRLQSLLDNYVDQHFRVGALLVSSFPEADSVLLATIISRNSLDSGQETVHRIWGVRDQNMVGALDGIGNFIIAVRDAVINWILVIGDVSSERALRLFRQNYPGQRLEPAVIPISDDHQSLAMLAARETELPVIAGDCIWVVTERAHAAPAWTELTYVVPVPKKIWVRRPEDNFEVVPS